MQDFNVTLKVHSTGDVLTVGEASAPAARIESRGRWCCGHSRHTGYPGLLCGREEHGPETHGQVLARHAVAVAEGRHQAQVVQKQRQGGLQGRGRAGLKRRTTAGGEGEWGYRVLLQMGDGTQRRFLSTQQSGTL